MYSISLLLFIIFLPKGQSVEQFKPDCGALMLSLTIEQFDWVRIETLQRGQYASLSVLLEPYAYVHLVLSFSLLTSDLQCWFSLIIVLSIILWITVTWCGRISSVKSVLLYIICRKTLHLLLIHQWSVSIYSLFLCELTLWEL